MGAASVAVAGHTGTLVKTKIPKEVFLDILSKMGSPVQESFKLEQLSVPSPHITFSSSAAGHEAGSAALPGGLEAAEPRSSSYSRNWVANDRPHHLTESNEHNFCWLIAGRQRWHLCFRCGA